MMISSVKPWKQYLNEYCSENFVYAVRYLAMQDITKEEMLWWILWIGASFAACIFSMFQIYGKWDANPVTIVYGSDLMPVSTVPFPAITICPLSKSRTDMVNLTWSLAVKDLNLTMLDEDSEMKIRTLKHVCPFANYWRKFDTEKKENVVANLRAMAQPLETVMAHCWWRSKLIPCKNIMMERLLDDGICYTFNSMALDEIYRTDIISSDFFDFHNVAPRSDWTRENGYRVGAGFNAYPHRPLSNGMVSGIIMAAVVNRADQEPICMGAHSGFKFSIHAPDEIAVTQDRFYRLNNKSAAVVSVSVDVFKATDTLRSIKSNKRNCVFNNEGYLQFFKQYNQFNCIIECVANYTLAKCGCVKFSMPRLINTKVCDASKVECYSASLNTLFELAIEAQLTKKKVAFCRCLPSCNSIDYQVGYTQIPINDFPIKLDFMRDNVDPGLFFVSLRDRHFFSLWRREMVGVNQAVAQLGGLFALLMGSSMLSLAEIAYYCCVRRLRREQPRQKRKSGLKRPLSRGHRIHLRVEPYAKQKRCSEQF